jgi:8-oxo-dGTP diphosphatase
MTSNVYELNHFGTYKYVMIITKYEDKWLLCQHKDRETWEIPGGHIEENETPLQAACRELYEETGAVEYKIRPLFDYSLNAEHGMVFESDVSVLDDIPDSEMACIAFYDELPENLTYKDITTQLMLAYLK